MTNCAPGAGLPSALRSQGWDHFIMVYLYQEKITPPGPLPARTKPPDVLTLQHTIKSLEQSGCQTGARLCFEKPK
jgi:hypothetical protein